MSPTALRSWLPRLSGQCVLVIGDIVLDAYIHGETRRLSPEAPVPIVEVRRREQRPGGAANVAANVTSLGGLALLGGVIGADSAANFLTLALQKHHVEIQGLVVDGTRPTTSKTRTLIGGRQVARLDEEQTIPLPAPIEEALLNWAEHHIPRAGAVVLSDYQKGVVSARLASRVIEAARRAGCPLVADPKCADPSIYRGATVVKPNRTEATILTGQPLNTPGDAARAACRLVECFGGASVLLTLGAEGMLLSQSGQPILTLAAASREVFDVTGAGDTVAAVLAMALGAGTSLEVAAYLANAAAGVAVSKVGTATVTIAELDHALALAPSGVGSEETIG